MRKKPIRLFTGITLFAYLLHIIELWISGGFSSSLLRIQNLYARYEAWFPDPETAYTSAIFGGIFLFLLIVYFLNLRGRFQALAMAFIGLLLILEGHHFWESVKTASYAPGAITGLLLAGLGIILFKESFKRIFSSLRG